MSDKTMTLDYYDAGLLGEGGGGDVSWWHDYIRSELDRAHEFYQDQADAITRHLSQPAERGEAVKAVPWTSDPTVVCLSLADGTQCNVYPESRVNETDVDEQQYFLAALARSVGDAK